MIDPVAGRIIAIGFQRWKQPQLAPMLRPLCKGLHFASHAPAASKLKPQSGDMLLWWSSQALAGVPELAHESHARTCRMEDGFIRSVGLGSDLIPPLSIVLDEKGIYFDPRQPSALEEILLHEQFSQQDIDRAQAVRHFIVERELTKYNIESRTPANWHTQGRRVILVPGQVETDASIRFGCSDITTNAGLLQAVRAADPDAYIVYKPHPDVMSGNRRGRLALSQAREWADHIETKLSVISCINACDALHTMTSLAGFDALLRDKQVITYGQPFYAGWGLTKDRDDNGSAFQRRQRKLTLDELVAGALLGYPAYWDPRTSQYSDCETALKLIARQRDEMDRSGELAKLNSGFLRRQMRKIAAWIRAVMLTPN